MITETYLIPPAWEGQERPKTNFQAGLDTGRRSAIRQLDETGFAFHQPKLINAAEGDPVTKLIVLSSKMGHDRQFARQLQRKRWLS